MNQAHSNRTVGREQTIDRVEITPEIGEKVVQRISYEVMKDF